MGTYSNDQIQQRIAQCDHPSWDGKLNLAWLGCEISDLQQITGHAEICTRLTTLDLSGNGLTDAAALAEALKPLTRLTTLVLRGNGLTDAAALAEALKPLTRLTTLDLWGNRLTDAAALAEALKPLTRLTTLVLSENAINEVMPLEILLPAQGGSLRTLYIRGCSRARLPDGRPLPESILQIADASRLFEEIHRVTGGRPLREMRLVAVGAGMAGKTYLSRWLAGAAKPHEHVPRHDRTKGFTRFTLDPSIRLRDGPVRATLFDCGGQPEQYSTHQLFYASNRNLFLLCLDATRSWRENWADRRLRMIKALAGRKEQVGVVVAVTHCDTEHGKQRRLEFPGRGGAAAVTGGEAEALERRLGEAYGLAVRVVDGCSNWEGVGLDRVRDAVRDLAERVPAVRRELDAPLPLELPQLREWVRGQFAAGDGAEVASVTRQAFEARCEEMGCKAGDLATLHTLGDVIYVGDDDDIRETNSRLRDHVLNPLWFSKWAYLVVTNDDARTVGGYIDRERMKHLLAPLPADQRAMLLELLERRHTIIPYEGEDEESRRRVEGYVVPDLLLHLDEAEEWGDAVCGATADFGPYLPEVRFARIAAAFRHEIVFKRWFRNEFVIQAKGGRAEALVQADFARQTIRVQVRGPDRAEAVALRDRLLHVIKPNPGAAWPELHMSDRTQPPPRAPSRRFAVAFSFPGEHREFIRKIDHALTSRLPGEEIFLDERYEAEVAGFEADLALQKIYHDEAELVVLFFCKAYQKKEWCCKVEWRAIRDLIKKRRGESLLPLRLDMDKVDGVFSTDICPNVSDRSPDDVANLIYKRLMLIRGSKSAASARRRRPARS